MKIRSRQTSRMNRTICLLRVFSLIIIGGSVAVHSYWLPKKVTFTHEKGDTKPGLAGLEFSEPTVEPKLKARELYHLVKDRYESTVEPCSSLNIDYQLVTIPNANRLPQQATIKEPKITINGHMDATPAYVVSLKDVKSSSFGSSEVSISTVVFLIDANTGEEILSTSYF